MIFTRAGLATFEPHCLAQFVFLGRSGLLGSFPEMLWMFPGRLDIFRKWSDSVRNCVGWVPELVWRFLSVRGTFPDAIGEFPG